ncbi:MAG: DNA-directed RNA polymerase subunit alpha [Anaerolineae bacterium]
MADNGRPTDVKIEVEASSRNYARFRISPLDRGYGTTVGNALRRVLLSSLPGVAVTSIKIDGVHHEFSPIPTAKEDTTRLVLNVKQLRLKMTPGVDGPVRMRLDARGSGVVTAADIEAPSEIEIINQELPLLTLDNQGHVDVEMIVERGMGYVPAERHSSRLAIGELPVDAIFSPVRKVSFRVEPARVEQATDYDRLILEVWTDGTMVPQDAVQFAAERLVREFQRLVAFGAAIEPEPQTSGIKIPPEVYDMPIEALELPVRGYNCLKRAGITRVGEVLEKLRKGDDEMLVIRNFGLKSLNELKDALTERDLMQYVGTPVNGRDGSHDFGDDVDDLIEE